MAPPDVQWVNLHPQPLNLPGVLNPKNDGIDTLAALIAACDAIVSVDTFTLHLAGSLRKRTFALLGELPYWYFIGPKQSMFYPTVELLGRTERDLDGAVDEAIDHLRSFDHVTR